MQVPLPPQLAPVFGVVLHVPVLVLHLPLEQPFELPSQSLSRMHATHCCAELHMSRVPEHVPHDPLHLLSPHCLPLHCGVQMHEPLEHVPG
jgi:hypothetical protein